jgi:hypothetical protein
VAQRVGAAQPIADVIQKGINTVTNIFGSSANGVGKVSKGAAPTKTGMQKKVITKR